MNDTFEKFQKEFDDDMNALEALSKQAENCQAVIDIIKKMPENKAWVVIGVGVGSERPDAEINLRGLGCDEVAALLSATQTTLCTLKKSIHTIQAKYPNLNPGSGEDGAPIQKVENHYHYHFHGQPHHHGHWAPPEPSCPPDDEEADELPGCGCGCQEPDKEPEGTLETPGEGDEGVNYDKGDEPDPDTGEEPLAYADGGWGRTADEYEKYRGGTVNTDSGLNLG